MQTATLLGFDTKIVGSTNDYSKTAGSEVAVITSGIPRKSGMTREELIGINAGIVKTVVANLIKHSPNVIIIVVSNPMDTMTYLAHKATGLPQHRIIGMGGALDCARFKCGLSRKELTDSVKGIPRVGCLFFIAWKPTSPHMATLVEKRSGYVATCGMGEE